VCVQDTPSLHVTVVPGNRVVHVDVPLQERVSPHGPGSFTHNKGVPLHCPEPLHRSVCVQAAPSSQVTVVPGKDVAQVEVPLHARTTPQGPGSLVQVRAVPLHPPAPSQRSVCVHAAPSSQLTDVLGKPVAQVAVPSHLRIFPQGPVSEVQVRAVPLQAPAPSQRSVCVHAAPSSQEMVESGN
jgi:hypothetical protein